MPVVTGSTVFGALVSTVGVALIVIHVAQRRRDELEVSRDDRERQFRERRYRRRIQTSALLTTLGALLAMFNVLPLEDSPLFFSAYVFGLLLLSLWLVLLALSDMVSTRVHSTHRLSERRQTRESLEAAIAELRRATRISSSSRHTHDPTKR